MKAEEELDRLNNVFKNLYQNLTNKCLNLKELSQTINELKFER